MKIEKQHTSVELGNFFIYGSEMRIFCQLTILTCVVKRPVLVLIFCSLAWRFVSLLLNSLYTAVLVFKLRPSQCLLTPIFTLMTWFFKFFLFVYGSSVCVHSRNCVGFNWNFAFSSAVNDLIVSIRRTSTYVYKCNARHKKKVIRLNGMFLEICSLSFFTQGQFSLNLFNVWVRWFCV